MDCQDARERLTLLVGGGISLTELALLGAHVKQCAKCWRDLDLLRQEGRTGSRHVARMQDLRAALCVAIPFGPATRAGSEAVAVTWMSMGRRLSTLLTGVRSQVDIFCGASTRFARKVTEIVGGNGSRLFLLGVCHLTSARARKPLAAAAGIVLTTGLTFYALGQLPRLPMRGAAPVYAPPTQPQVAPLEAAAFVGPPAGPEPRTLTEAPADVLPEQPQVARPEAAGARLAPDVRGPTPGNAAALPQTRPGASSTARPTVGEARSTPVATEAESADALAVPDVIGRLSVRNVDAAERDLAVLLERLGGTQVSRRRSHTSTMLYAVVPGTGYTEFSRGLAAIGSWLVEAQRSSLPDGIRVIIRLSEEVSPRPRAASVPQVG